MFCFFRFEAVCLLNDQVVFQDLLPERVIFNFKGLLTECEVPRSVRENIWSGFRTDRATKEKKCEKTEGKYFPVQTEWTRLIRLLLYGFWFSFFFAFSSACVRLQMLPFILYLWLWACSFRFMFTLVRHSFAFLIHKQLSRKTTLFQDVLLFKLLHKTYLIVFYFDFNQLRNFPAKTYWSGKKRIALSQQPISVRHDLKTSWTIK